MPQSITNRLPTFNLNLTPKHIQSLITAHPGRTATITLLTALTAVLLPPTIKDYTAWHALGLGGVPHNLLGYISQVLLQPLAFKDRVSPAIYQEPKISNELGEKRDLAFLTDEAGTGGFGTLPQRKGDRPAVGPWVVPHRQTSQISSPETKKRIQEFILAFATPDFPALVIATSKAERHGPALFVAPYLRGNSIVKRQQGEVAHMHPADGSCHVVLSVKDAEQVLEMGWGERHALSGSLVWAGMVMLYAPRDEEEVEVMKRIIRAAVRFMLNLAGEQGKA